MIIRPYLLVPKLIPQPTWGGTYIATTKKLDPALFGKLPIGQSYELATESALSTVERSELLPIEICTATDGTTQEVVGDKTTLFSLQDLINKNPNEVLGKKVVSLHGNSMQVLIKFTQAKGNSFQVHVRPSTPVASWKPKPESWYFFEKGKVTLGLKRPIQLDAYKQACIEIDQHASELSAKVKASQMSLPDAKKTLTEFIQTHSPFQFVNELTVEANTVVDLSEGGVHHSWEEGPEIPDGNILYEVQLNVMDKDCTLRSFDKGKMADDGSVRPVHVAEYIQAINPDESANDPNQYMRIPMFHSEEGITIAKLFTTPHYNSSVLELAGRYEGSQTDTTQDDSFHHLFVQSGEIRVVANTHSLVVSQGASVFLPSSTGQYSIESTGKTKVIKTWQ